MGTVSKEERTWSFNQMLKFLMDRYHCGDEESLLQFLVIEKIERFGQDCLEINRPQSENEFEGIQWGPKQ